MKKWIVVLLLFCLNKSFSQTQPDYESIKLEQKEDYKVAEPTATQAANYILSVPNDKKNNNRVLAVRFLFRWMAGTPDYSFTLDEHASKLMNDNNDLLVIYMASMAKYCTENKESGSNTKALKLNATRLLLTYCENADNKIKMTKALKKLSEANKKGELEKEL